MIESNGIRKLLYWMLGLAGTIIVTGGSIWISQIQSKADVALATLAARGERIAVLETILPRIEKRLDAQDEKLSRIEQMLSKRK